MKLANDQDLTSIVMSDADNVATLLKEIEAGESLQFAINGEKVTLTAKQAIPFCHKIAIKPIQPSEHVVKYGQVIGAATVEIFPGEHVHVHNIEGIRGRGDKKKGDSHS
ncbi:SAF domain-containing protein [Neobacillus bataviensis LMG 21833]|uniref:SAF domain-containing protein n=1 Tax=Neobacillus bataviensis LMG 21833 TaxID=1117379 RepID=K6CYG5_9BACI|nr:UxaA family hydrolase [Neobacillus bataviensis]EKN65272.1 SAF domain-containing protein [Neobacillus bataviensis LMG 21833]